MTDYIPDIIIYHHPCADGFAAAWACHAVWDEFTTQYHPTNYGKEPPNVRGKHVLIVDFSYKADVLREMGKLAKSIIILDHHKSAQAELREWAVEMESIFDSDPETICRRQDDRTGLPIAAVFDMERSGARLAWEFAVGTEPPLLIKLVEDRDLWRFQYPETKPFALMLKTEEESFASWDLICIMLDNDTDLVLTQADGMVRYQDYLVGRLAAKAFWKERGGIRFLAVNCPAQLSSEVGNRILELHPETPFAATWNDGETHRGWSLRSTDDRMDVSDFASGYGGGGHRNAAGFSEPLL